MVRYIKKQNFNIIMNKNILITILLFTFLLISGCSSNTTVNDLINSTNNTINQVMPPTPPNVPVQPNTQPTPTISLSQNPNGLKIGSWNLDNLNLNNIKEVSTKLKQYGIVAIQGINNPNELMDSTCTQTNFASQSKDYLKFTNAFAISFNDSKYKIIISPLILDKRYAFYYDSSKVNFNSCYFSKDQNSGELCQTSSTGLVKYDDYNCRFSYGGKNFVIQNFLGNKFNMQELFGVKVLFDMENEKNKNTILTGKLYNDCSIVNSNSLSKYNQVIQQDCSINSFVFQNQLTNGLLYTQINGIDNNFSKTISLKPISWINIK